MELSVKQLKAVTMAFPLYYYMTGDTNEEEERAKPLLPEFTASGVPRLVQAFRLSAVDSSSKANAALRPKWRRAVPTEVDSLLITLFPIESSTPAFSGSHRGADKKPLRALNANEIRLMHMYTQAQEKNNSAEATTSKTAGSCSNGATSSNHTDASLQDSVAELTKQLALLKGYVATMASAAASRPEHSHCCCRCGSQGQEEERSSAVLRHTVLSSTGPSSVRNTALPGDCKNAFTSALADIPVTHTGARDVPVTLQSIEVVCEGCHEVGGELFRCTHCNSAKHEACGGPKVSSSAEPQASDGLCRECCHALCISSSEGSLRSTTSSSERAAIDAYFGSDCESDASDATSLSGFIVGSSEEEEGEEEEGEEAENRSDDDAADEDTLLGLSPTSPAAPQSAVKPPRSDARNTKRPRGGESAVEAAATKRNNNNNNNNNNNRRTRPPRRDVSSSDSD